MPGRYVVFSHGQHAGPWGHKITVLAQTVRGRGWQAESVDYRGIDSPEERAAKLIAFCKTLYGDVVLVGSSLGGYVALAAATQVHARGVFLMAPAIYMEGLPPLPDGIPDCPLSIVHGWHDAVIPCDHSVRFAQSCNATLHLVDGDHGLHSQVELIGHWLEAFLDVTLSR